MCRTAWRSIHPSALIRLGILALLAVVSLLTSQPGYAYGQVQTGTYAKQQWWSPPCTSDSILAGAPCAVAANNGVPIGEIGNCSVLSQTSNTAQVRCYYLPNGNAMLYGVTATVVQVAGSCPPNSRTSSVGTCICNSGYKDQGISCEVAQCDQVGGYSMSTQPDLQVLTANTKQCRGGCAVAASKVSVGPDGRMWAQWPFISLSSSPDPACGGLVANGQPVTPVDSSGTTLGQPAPIPCAPGTAPGTVNGSPVCVPQSGTVTSKDSISPTGALTREVTTCTNGSCSTVKINPDGSSGGQVVGSAIGQAPGVPGGVIGGVAGTDPQKPFCTDNPNSIICKTSSISGACDAVACDGDAVQCAMAKEQAKRMCELMDKVTPLATKGIEATTAGDVPTDHPGAPANVTSIGVPALSDAPLFGSSNGCPSDVTVALRFGTVTIPFSSMCSSLALLGLALKGLAYLSAAMIIFRRGV